MDKKLEKLDDLRKEIDALDRLLLEILKKRFRLVQKIGTLKQKLNLPVLQPGRWKIMQEIHSKRAGKLGLDVTMVGALMNLIHKESLRIQKAKRKEVKR